MFCPRSCDRFSSDKVELESEPPVEVGEPSEEAEEEEPGGVAEFSNWDPEKKM